MTAQQPNVVVVVLDTTRGLDTVPVDDSLQPTIASLADAGTEYRRAFSAAPWTLPSHAGLLTGTYPSKHGAHGANPVLDESLMTLPGIFSAQGYETRAISNNTWISGEFGFGRGFDEFHCAWTATDPESATAPSGDDCAGDDAWRTRATAACDASPTTDLALEWLSSMTGRPFFLLVNYIDAHFEYAPPEEYVRDRLPTGAEPTRASDILEEPRAFDAGAVSLTEDECAQLRALYRGELAYLDHNVGALVDGLKAVGEWEDTILVITSDHGENVGEHGFVGHQYNLYDTLLHVPLVIVGGSFDRGRSTDRLVQLTDLPATLLDEVRVDAPAARRQFQGPSFHPAAATLEREHVIAEYVQPRPSIDVLEGRYGELPATLYSIDRALPLRAVRTDEYKLILGADGSKELYHVDNDPGETENLAGERDDVAARLAAELESLDEPAGRQPSRHATDFSPDTKERLSDLGYL